MLEFNEEIPFLWRLSGDSGDGFSVVSMVIPFKTGSENLEHTIPTDVVSFSGDHEKLADEETLEWNDDDIHLFLKLLASRKGDRVQDNPAAQTQTFRVDLSDPDTIEIVNIVAAAGFGMALIVDDLLVADPGDSHSTNVDEPEVGLSVTLHTVDGYKRGVVVGGDEDEVVCVMLDRINTGHPKFEEDFADIQPHDLVVVRSHQLLPANYSSQAPAATDVLH